MFDSETERIRCAVRRYLDHPDRRLSDWSQFMEAAREEGVSVGDLQQAVSIERDRRFQLLNEKRKELKEVLERHTIV
jgi:hypothetical protein